MEIWKDIKDYEGFYQVSNMGRVRALDRIVADSNKERTQKIKGKIIKATDNGSGYKLVCLNKNSKRKNHYIHRLVAETFIPNPNDVREVNHKDFNKANNRVENLEWVTSSGNKEHFFKDIRGKEKARKCAETKFKHIVANREKEIIYDYNKNNLPISIIAKKYSLACSTVSKLLKMNNVKLNPNKKCYRQHIRRGKNGKFLRKVI